MKSFLVLGALAAVGRALPQEIQWSAVDGAPAPPSASVPIGAAAQTVSYDPDLAASSAAAVISAAPLPQLSQPVKRGIEKRTACAPQPTGAGTVPSPDTASNFLSFPDFAAAASAAPTPSSYTNTFTNLQASNNAYGYLGFSTLGSYDSLACAAKCDAITGCSAFNLYFERDPTLVSLFLPFKSAHVYGSMLGSRCGMHQSSKYHCDQMCFLGWPCQQGQRE
jgi:hypothetical protein